MGSKQLAPEEKSRQYEREREERADRKNNENDDDENSPRYQFMVYTRQSRSGDVDNDHTLDDPAEENERELLHKDGLRQPDLSTREPRKRPAFPTTGEGCVLLGPLPLVTSAPIASVPNPH